MSRQPGPPVIRITYASCTPSETEIAALRTTADEARSRFSGMPGFRITAL